MSGRNNVDIEIYGMEGIPETDLRQHEKNNGPPEVRMTYPDEANLVLPQKPPSMPAPGMMPLGFMPNPGAPYMAGIMPPMPFGVPPNSQFPTMPPPIPGGFPGASVAAPVPGSLLGNAPPGLAVTSSAPTTHAPKPLFPSLAGSSNSSSSSATTTAAASSAPVSNSSSTHGTIVTITNNTRIIHPEEDLSLEELRARLPRYKHLNLETCSTAAPQPPPTSAANQQTVSMQSMYGNMPPNQMAPHIPPNMFPGAHFMPPPHHHNPAHYQPSFRPAYWV